MKLYAVITSIYRVNGTEQQDIQLYRDQFNAKAAYERAVKIWGSIPKVEWQNTPTMTVGNGCGKTYEIVLKKSETLD